MNNTKNLNMQERAKKRMPGMTQLLSKRPDQFSLGVWPGYYSKAKGAEVWDLDGNKYLDMSIGGIGANILGFADDDVNAAVYKAIKNGSSSSLNSPEEVELSELLCEIHPWADKVRYARTGGEAMAVAVRIARASTGRDKVAFCGYHGWHDWYLSANLGTENALGEHLLSGLDPLGVPKGLTGTSFPFTYNKIEELRDIVAKHGNEIAAIVMEPIRDDAPDADFVDEVRAIADKIKTVLVIDEISAGFRLNTGGSHLLYNIKPDIAVFSKALGNGFPVAAIIGKEKVMDAAQKTFISSTMWTECIGPTAALATIKKHKACNVAEHLISIGSSVQEGWKTLSKKHGLKIHVGGIAPISHFSFEYNNAMVLKAFFVQLMLERGFLASTLFYSMYAHQTAHVNSYLQSVDEVFAIIANANQKGEVETKLKGKPATAGFKRIT
ncbi:MAG: aminotransferase class III-fold pyridoxal phosphate-dependent enzyme [PVC group bacterium]|nr:aminotransferase class III-fold pyridoxal phosphate-dependent enzyme [PVC group bacterium]